MDAAQGLSLGARKCIVASCLFVYFLKISPILTRLGFKFKTAGCAPRPCSPWPGAADLRGRERPLRDSPPEQPGPGAGRRQKRSVDNTAGPWRTTTVHSTSEADVTRTLVKARVSCVNVKGKGELQVGSVVGVMRGHR